MTIAMICGGRAGLYFSRLETRRRPDRHIAAIEFGRTCDPVWPVGASAHPVALGDLKIAEHSAGRIDSFPRSVCGPTLPAVRYT